jgi:hypothetical protein
MSTASVSLVFNGTLQYKDNSRISFSAPKFLLEQGHKWQPLAILA